MTPKERILSLAKGLREAAHLQDPTARGAVDLVKLWREDLKERLVDADGEDMLRMQGAIRQFDKLYKELTITPPTIVEYQEQTNG